MDGIRLETDRLVLRRFGVQDMAALHLLLADEEVNTFLPWFPSKSMEDTRRFYAQRLAEGKYCFCRLPDRAGRACRLYQGGRKPCVRKSGTGALQQRRAGRWQAC